MEVGKGYKQTDVGVIPEDWDVSPLGKQLRKIPSYGINAPAIPFDFRFPTYLRITDIDEDGRFTESTKASVNHSMSSSYLIEHGDLVFARTGASVGKSYLYNPKDGQLVYAGFLILVSPDPKRLIPTFLKYYVQSKTYWNWIKTNSMRSGQPGINGREYASLPIPLPPTLAEQEAIAEALSDADALIESLETLLAKKRQVKQGAMSELLSGKRRLPEFERKQGYKKTEVGEIPEDWAVKSIKELNLDISDGNYSSKYPKASDFRSIGIPFIRANNIRNMSVVDDDLRYISESQHAELLRGHLKKNDILITTRGEIGQIAFVPDRHIDSNINAQLVRINADKTAHNGRFIGYMMAFDNIHKQFENLQTGSALKQLPIGKFITLLLSLPPTKAEQTAIAEILSDMDAEIRAVEEKLSKARGVKAGMMSELLTGKTRLV